MHSGDSACAIPPPTLDDETVAVHRGLHAPRSPPRSESSGRSTSSTRCKQRPGLRHRGEPAGEPDGALRRQGDRASRSRRSRRGSCSGRRSPSCAPRGCSPPRDCRRPEHVSVKEAVLPFDRFPEVDALLGPEMRSTGEVMGIDRDLRPRVREEPDRGRQPPSRRRRGLLLARRPGQGGRGAARRGPSSELGFALVATEGTADFLERHGVPVETAGRQGRRARAWARARRRRAHREREGAASSSTRRAAAGPRADGAHIRRAASAHRVPDPHDRRRGARGRGRHRRLGPPPPRGAEPPGAPRGARRAARLFADPAP